MRNHRYVTDRDTPAPDVVKAIGQALGLVAGFVALIYAAGGSVLALRLFLADLPSRTVVGQLPRDLLISVGLAQIVLPALAVAAAYVVARLLVGRAPPPRRLVRQWSESSRDWLTLVGASAVPAAILTGLMALKVDRSRLGWDLTWVLPVAFVLTLLVVLVALNLRARVASQYAEPAQWNARRAVVWMTLVVALASIPACVIFAGTINLLDAKVCMTGGSQVTGVLIGETGDRVYVGQTKRKRGPLLVFSVPESRVKETFIGGNAGARPCS